MRCVGAHRSHWLRLSCRMFESMVDTSLWSAQLDDDVTTCAVPSMFSMLSRQRFGNDTSSTVLVERSSRLSESEKRMVTEASISRQILAQPARSKGPDKGPRERPGFVDPLADLEPVPRLDRERIALTAEPHGSAHRAGPDTGSPVANVGPGSGSVVVLRYDRIGVRRRWRVQTFVAALPHRASSEGSETAPPGCSPCT